MVDMKFSVLMSVYRNDNPKDFQSAFKSISDLQTLKPSEIVLVVDGPIGERLNMAIEDFEKNCPCLKVLRLKENVGLGKALSLGLAEVSYELVARMDADDLSVPDRFKKQIVYMQNHPDCDLLGGQITEFIEEPWNKVGKRIVPCEDVEIAAWMKKRCPFNHMTVMFRKSSVLRAGNYLDWHYNEDYYLWIRIK